MIAIDTNVLVRVLVEDDLEQTKRVRTLLEGCLATGETCFVSDVALAETVWVIEDGYGFSRGEISASLRQLAQTGPFVFESRSRVLDTLDRFDAGKADFSDYLLLYRGADAGARALYSFDRKLLREKGVRQP